LNLPGPKTLDAGPVKLISLKNCQFRGNDKEDIFIVEKLSSGAAKLASEP
jgi:hypothetical protein